MPFFFAKLGSTTEDYYEFMSRPAVRIFAYMRLLRITQLPKILDASNVYAYILMHKFPMKRQIIHNTK